MTHFFAETLEEFTENIPERIASEIPKGNPGEHPTVITNKNSQEVSGAIPGKFYGTLSKISPRLISEGSCEGFCGNFLTIFLGNLCKFLDESRKNSLGNS